MEKWHTGPEYQRIGDIMLKNAPFLKMYTEYVKNFDTAMNTMNTQYNKNSKFSAIVDDIHVSDEIIPDNFCSDPTLCRAWWSARVSPCSTTCSPPSRGSLATRCC